MIHALGLLALLSVPGSSPYEILDPDREIALAKSAGLSPWNEEATIWYVIARGDPGRVVRALP
jgi:hypothetical protein